MLLHIYYRYCLPRNTVIISLLSKVKLDRYTLVASVLRVYLCVLKKENNRNNLNLAPKNHKRHKVGYNQVTKVVITKNNQGDLTFRPVCRRPLLYYLLLYAEMFFIICAVLELLLLQKTRIRYLSAAQLKVCRCKSRIECKKLSIQ